jgi:hypothetical protein
MWMNEFKVALIQKDVKTLDTLILEMPQFETLDEMQEAFYLMNHAKDLLENLKNETAITMKKIKENIRYIESTQQAKTSLKLDIIQ